MFDLQINPIDFTDWSGLFNLLKESFSYMDGRIDPPSSFHRLDINTLELKAKQENFIIANMGGQLIGCAFFKTLHDATYVGKVAVSSKYRQLGLAREMFEKIEQLAVKHGFHFLELETRVELTENHQTFASMGFIKVSESAHAGYDQPTSITMRKRLASDR